MAFTTQKDVLKIGFLNESLAPACMRKPGVALKSYSSSTDVRALDSRRNRQAQFIADLVACRTYAGASGDVCPMPSPRDRGNVKQESVRGADLEVPSDLAGPGPGGIPGSGGIPVSGGIPGSVGMPGSGYIPGSGGIPEPGGVLGSRRSHTDFLGVPDTDSLIFKATERLSNLENILKENKELKENLICSADEFNRIAKENEKLKQMFKSGDASKLDEFEKKVRSLQTSGKINSQDIEDLLNLRKQIGDRQKAIELLEAENNALKKLTEKLSARAKIPEISIQKETSTDVAYLQDTVNNLKQEIGVLRAMENEFAKVKIDFASMKKKYDSMNEKQKQEIISKDAEHVKSIIEERNKLRQQIDKMIGMEGKIAKLREKALKAEKMEKQIGDMQNGSKLAADTLKDCKFLTSENAKLKKNLQELEGELSCLRKKICCDSQKIHHYEHEIDKLIAVIEELRCALMSKMNEQKDSDENKQELISASKSCLEKIYKEVKLRCKLEKELKKCRDKLKEFMPDADAFLAEKPKKEAGRKMERKAERKTERTFAVEEIKSDGEIIQDEGKQTDEGIQDDKQLQDDAQIRDDAQIQKEQIEEKEKQLLESHHEVEVAKHGIEEKEMMLSSEAQKNQKLLEEQSLELSNKEKLLNETQKELDQFRNEVNKYAERVRGLEKENEDCKASNVKCSDELNSLKGKYADLEKALAQAREDNQNKLGEYENLITKFKEGIAKLQQELNDSKSENGNIKSLLSQRDGEINNLKQGVQQCRAEMDKIQSAANLQIEALKNEIDQLNSKINAKDGEIQKLKDKIGGFKDQLSSKDGIINNLKDEKNRLNDEISKLNAESSSFRAEKDRLLGQLNQSQAEINNLKNQLTKATRDVEHLRKEVNICTKEKSELSQLVGEIERERKKNRDLQGMIENLEKKVSSMPQPLSQQQNVGPTASGNLQASFNALQAQLDKEKANNNDLLNQLQQCRMELQQQKAASDAAAGVRDEISKPIGNEIVKSGSGPAETGFESDQERAGPLVASSVVPASGGIGAAGRMDLGGIRSLVERELDNVKKEHMNSLKKLQEMHEKQLKELTEMHETEVGALKKANNSMRSSLENVRKGKDDDRFLTKLQCICKKIVDTSIECLSLSELTYLHTEVYKAGLKLKPELLKCANISGGSKCCECSGFSCCLPNISKDKEKKFVERIVNLEKDLNNANKILQYLRMHTDNKAQSSPCRYREKTVHSGRPNDEINKFLKKYSSTNIDKICSAKRPVSKRK